jgi:ATP-dependent RNA helicase DeaD
MTEQQLAANFADLNLSAPLLQALAELGYETPSPIQAACIPHLMSGSDILGEAQTGTGKTAAFALPLLQRLDLAAQHPQILVLTPTRELAIQVAEAFQSYARYLRDFHVLPIYGGQSMVVQLRQLKRGAHVIVGTPGRIMDHLERKSLDLSKLNAVVLDEADEMLRMGFIDDVEWILSKTPETSQTALFSATMPSAIRDVARKHLTDPQEVRIKNATSTVDTITQRYWQVRGVNKLDALTRILEAEEDFDAAIIFVRTKISTEELSDKLEARGYAAAAINGDMQQGARERVIEQLKSGALDVLVATDVAARGIDVPRVTHVINYDIPYDTEAYVHRIGRTGRAGRQGNAILFVAPRERGMLRAIERATRQPITQISLPTREDVQEKRVSQLKQQILDVIEGEDLVYFGEVLGQLVEENDLTLENVAPALLYLAQRERPLQVEEQGAGWEIATSQAQQEPARRSGERSNDDFGGERPRRERAPRREFTSTGGSQRYRIEVGRHHNVTPKEIVGAIANEGGIDGRQIGQIDLFGEFSTVELPELPGDVLQTLKRTRVRQRPLNIRPMEPGESTGERREEGYRRPSSDNGDRPRRPAPSGDAPARRSFSGPESSSYGDAPFRRGSSSSPAPRGRSEDSHDARPRRSFGDSAPSSSSYQDKPRTSFKGSSKSSSDGNKPPRKPWKG